MREKRETLIVRIAPTLKERLRGKAKEKNTKISVVVREAVEKFFQNPVTVEELKAQFLAFKEELQQAAAIENIKAFSRGVFLGWYGHLFPESPSSIEAWVEGIADKTGKTPAQTWADMEKFEKAALELWKKRKRE